MKILMWLCLLLLSIPIYSQQYVVIDSVNKALGLLPETNKSIYEAIEIAYVDTFNIFWVDDAIQIDSVKAISDDSVSIQIRIVGGSTTTLFASSVLINGSSTLTSFSDATLAFDESAYLYFTYLGDTVTRLRLKIYWRYL